MRKSIDLTPTMLVIVKKIAKERNITEKKAMELILCKALRQDSVTTWPESEILRRDIAGLIGI